MAEPCIKTDEIKELQENMETINRAIFGNKDMQTKGMKTKVDEMHAFFVESRGISKFFLKTLYVLGAMGGLVATYLIIKEKLHL